MTSNGTDPGSGTSQSKPYSIWMAESVIARGQGLASPDGDSGQWLRIGFFQTALLEILSANGLDYGRAKGTSVGLLGVRHTEGSKPSSRRKEKRDLLLGPLILGTRTLFPV